MEKGTKSTKKPAPKKGIKTVKNIVSDYNKYDYKEFWQNTGREYEDAADRMAVRRLLPRKSKYLVDVAGGFGRLADEYLPRADKAVLFDYSQIGLDHAKKKYGKKLGTRQGDIYDLPFKDGEVSTVLMVRATHHFKDIDKVFKELYRILEPGGVAVIEVANKRTLPRIARYLTGKTKISPFDRSVANLTDVAKDGFFNYHPKYIEELFEKTGFQIDKVLSVSNFRSARLKKMFGPERLTKMEKTAQTALAPVRFAPSIYYRLVKPNTK